jgi:hypothetical protein
MSHKLPRTLQAVPNTLHAQLEIADGIRKLGAADQEDWVQWRREELAALRQDVEKLRDDLSKISRNFPTLFLTELRKAGFDSDEPRVPAGNSKGGQWTKEGGTGSWIDSVADWFRHTSDPEWAEAQNVQDLGGEPSASSDNLRQCGAWDRAQSRNNRISGRRATR